jgi:hypothetical protein
MDFSEIWKYDMWKIEKLAAGQQVLSDDFDTTRGDQKSWC